jgi:hypothetical protein
MENVKKGNIVYVRAFQERTYTEDPITHVVNVAMVEQPLFFPERCLVIGTSRRTLGKLIRREGQVRGEIVDPYYCTVVVLQPLHTNQYITNLEAFAVDMKLVNPSS